MGGTRTGGLQAAITNEKKEPGFYKRIGKIGGHNGTTGGFAANRELASEAGRIGGAISRRGETRKLTENERQEVRKLYGSTERRTARIQVQRELSQMQTSRLSSKHGAQRPW